MLNVSTIPLALRFETQRHTRSRVTLLLRVIGFQMPLPDICAASVYALWRTVTTRFRPRSGETQHINDRLRAALAGALV
jgi:hypothetical protein